MKAITALKGALCAAAVFFLCGCMQSTGLGERAIVKAIYVDQLRLFSMNTFNNLELLSMELQFIF